MPLFQKPIFYPPTVMEKESAKILAIRVKVRPPVGGGATNQFLPPGPTAGTRTTGGARVRGAAYPLKGSSNEKFK